MKRIAVIAGASGVGKTTVANIILENERFSLVRSATTRKPRADGNLSEYIYLNRVEFLEAVKNGDMLEYTEYGENLYGTPKSELCRIFSEGKTPLLIVDMAGVRTFMNGCAEFSPEIFYIYEALDVIEKRLYERDLAEPTVDGFTSFIRRKNANIRDYIALPKIASGFAAFIKNDDPRIAADALISVFYGEPVNDSTVVTLGEDIPALALSLRESAELKI